MTVPRHVLRASRDTCNSRLKSCMIVCESRSCAALAVALFAIILILIFATGHGVLGRPSGTATAAGSAAALGRPPSARELGCEGGVTRIFQSCAVPAGVMARQAAAFEVWFLRRVHTDGY